MKPSSFQLLTASIQEKEWKALSGKKIYFGHQSVGYDIIAGIKDIMDKNRKVSLNIKETVDMTGCTNGVFAHSPNGENGDLRSKIDAFVKTMEGGMGQQADIAFFKFCFVDFNETTGIKELFNYYRSAMKGLKKKYPNITILHATVPLTTEGELLGVKDKAKDLIKIILGRTTGAEKNAMANIKRNEYNAALIKEYGRASIIDIALYESTGPDGKLYTGNNAGSEHASLVPAYTYDGGHLNETGKRIIADKFLAQLVRMR